MRRIKTISIEAFAKTPLRYMQSRMLPYAVKLNETSEVVFLRKEEYNQLRSLTTYKSLLDNISFLARNKSLEFLKEEPDLYEAY